MAKIKFRWELKVTEDEQYLEVYLNDGLNCRINIFHREFYENTLNVLQSIMYAEHEHFTKTEVLGLDQIEKARHIYSADFK